MRGIIYSCSQAYNGNLIDSLFNRQTDIDIEVGIRSESLDLRIEETQPIHPHSEAAEAVLSFACTYYSPEEACNHCEAGRISTTLDEPTKLLIQTEISDKI